GAGRRWNSGFEDPSVPGALETNLQRVIRKPDGTVAMCHRRTPSAYSFKVGDTGPLACFLSAPVTHFITGPTSLVDAHKNSRL
ncbi:MAG: hypothetical protein P8M16_10430, partial [Acidimicrobiales bacterium]|nr:hypothetical protein [Acidimicrobiales bacterium]